ncbi:alpha/beta hydrolase [Uruburuella testudinis]|uniref:Alpha/beta hydrolase n=1 Tax=Uruburuella testudinis TaxID=1282863 RepID=A0ABY4DYA5_9NEIS|nr:alpha/beta hydrolase [Uruburuella testudinis]UOO83049.1 alpha/beta hydrolase [Uruburuella testudinis]
MNFIISRRKFMHSALTVITAAALAAAAAPVWAQDRVSTTGNPAMTLNLTQEWDKIFPQSNRVDHQKVQFKNRYGITLAADLYLPKNRGNRKLPAIAVSGPFGAVKEQSSGLYAQTMAERGFITLAFDPSYTGESGGEPRNVASPDINTEDFSAAVDFLTTLSSVDAGRIGIIGICGWGGMALNAAAMDTRIKASVIATMYDMSRVMANGYNDSVTPEQRYQTRVQLNAQRTEDARSGTIAPSTNNLPEKLTGSEPKFVQDYFNFYKTPRGFHPRSVNSNGAWTATTPLSFMNMPLLSYTAEIRNPVLMVHGENAHSRYFGEDAFKKLTGNNKELLIIPGASHVDLYDNEAGKIPFDKFEQFFKANLK